MDAAPRRHSKLVVADSGPLIALARIDRLHLFGDLLLRAFVPTAVAEECSRNLEKPGARTIRSAIDEGILQISDPPPSGDIRFPSALGTGEREASRLALHLEALVLLDDLTARRTAMRLGLAVIGVGGMLLTAKSLGSLDEVGPILVRLRAFGYRLSRRLVDEILRRAGELAPPELS